ncbi:hypothetical protein ACLM5H_24700 [Fredinandcohnia humi]
MKRILLFLIVTFILFVVWGNLYQNNLESRVTKMNMTVLTTEKENSLLVTIKLEDSLPLFSKNRFIFLNPEPDVYKIDRDFIDEKLEIEQILHESVILKINEKSNVYQVKYNIVPGTEIGDDSINITYELRFLDQIYHKYLQ